MNNKLAKQLRKHVKETMSNNAQWVAYDTKIVKRPILTGKLLMNGSAEVLESVTNVKSLVKGCGKQRHKQMKKLYNRIKRGGLV